MKTVHPVLLFILSILFSLVVNSQNSLNVADFKSPPASVKVNTWWHWISGEITREGITKDLESMKQQGIVQATILNVGGLNSKRAGVPNIKFDTPEWHEMFKWALNEANRLGIKIGIHNCDGWSTSGGPWITPEQSMKQFVWNRTKIEGGKLITIQLPQPAGVSNFYRDVAVVAYPVQENDNSFHQAQPKMEVNSKSVETILTDGNPTTEVNFTTGDEITVALASDITVNKMVIFPHLVFSWDDMSKIKNRYVLSVSTDGKEYNKIEDVEFTGVNKSLAAIFPPVKGRYFKISCTSGGSPVGEMELLNEGEQPAYSPAIPFLLEKVSTVNALNEQDYDFSAGNQKGISPNTIVDLTGQMTGEGTLKWKAPKGKWEIIRFGYTTTGIKNGPATPEGTGLEVDKMDTAALNFHFNNFAGRLLQSAGSFTGNTFKFLLIDSWECQFQTWTRAFPEEFKNRRGYSITPWLPVLCGQTVGNNKLSEAFLHDFRKTIADLIDQNYYRHFGELCHKNNLEMHAEIIYGNSGMYPPLDAIKSNRYADLPMTEFWASPDVNQFPQYEPSKQPTAGFPTFASLACNQPIIGSEAYTGYAHYSESPFDLKPFGDAAFCSGINQIILHSYVHQPTDQKPGITLGKFAAHFNRNNPWWEYAGDWMNYQARVQYVFQQGEPIAEVLFYIGDQLPQYFGKSILNELPYGFQAAACNFDMLNNARVVDGKITFGGKQSYPVLALPKSKTMEYATLKRIAELVKEGAAVYGPKPLEILSGAEMMNHSEEFNKLANELWGTVPQNKYGKGSVISELPLEEVLKKLNVFPALTSNSKDAREIMFIHKRIGDTDVYYLFNQQKKDINREVTFNVKGKTPQIWNPENGSVSNPYIYSTENNQLRLPLSFKAYESKIVVFKNESPAYYISQVMMGGKQIFPGVETVIATDAIPQATYQQGKFGFVTDVKGDYIFTTNDNRTIKTNLVESKVFNIETFKGNIEFFPITNEVIQPLEITALKSFTEIDNPAIQYFAGKAKYTISFNAPESLIGAKDSVVLNLGNMDATAEVIFNGQLLTYAWMPNTALDVTHFLKKENQLVVTVANVCRNRFIGDLAQSGGVKSLWTTSPIESILRKDMPLKPSGLMGPLKLVSYSKQSE